MTEHFLVREFYPNIGKIKIIFRQENIKNTGEMSTRKGQNHGNAIVPDCKRHNLPKLLEKLKFVSQKKWENHGYAQYQNMFR